MMRTAILQEAGLIHTVSQRVREVRWDLMQQCSREGHQLELVFADATDRGQPPNAIFATCHTSQGVVCWQAQDGWRGGVLAEEGLLTLLHLLTSRHAKECDLRPLPMWLPDFGNFVLRRGLIRAGVPAWLHNPATCLCTRGTKLAFMGRTMPGTP